METRAVYKTRRCIGSGSFFFKLQYYLFLPETSLPSMKIHFSLVCKNSLFNQQTLKKVPPHYKLLKGFGIWIAIILKHAIWKIRLDLNILYLKQSKILKVQIMVWKEKCLEFLFVGIVWISLQYRLCVGFLKKKKKKRQNLLLVSLWKSTDFLVKNGCSHHCNFILVEENQDQSNGFCYYFIFLTRKMK